MFAANWTDALINYRTAQQETGFNAAERKPSCVQAVWLIPLDLPRHRVPESLLYATEGRLSEEFPYCGTPLLCSPPNPLRDTRSCPGTRKLQAFSFGYEKEAKNAKEMDANVN